VSSSTAPVPRRRTGTDRRTDPRDHSDARADAGRRWQRRRSRSRSRESGSAACSAWWRGTPGSLFGHSPALAWRLLARRVDVPTATVQGEHASLVGRPFPSLRTTVADASSALTVAALARAANARRDGWQAQPAPRVLGPARVCRRRPRRAAAAGLCRAAARAAAGACAGPLVDGPDAGSSSPGCSAIRCAAGFAPTCCMEGNYLVLDLGDRRYVMFAHLKQGGARVAASDRVQRGQPIAQVGNSGSTSDRTYTYRSKTSPPSAQPPSGCGPTRCCCAMSCSYAGGSHPRPPRQTLAATTASTGRRLTSPAAAHATATRDTDRPESPTATAISNHDRRNRPTTTFRATTACRRREKENQDRGAPRTRPGDLAAANLGVDAEALRGQRRPRAAGCRAPRFDRVGPCSVCRGVSRAAPARRRTSGDACQPRRVRRGCGPSCVPAVRPARSPRKGKTNSDPKRRDDARHTAATASRRRHTVHARHSPRVRRHRARLSTRRDRHRRPAAVAPRPARGLYAVLP
jgi:hypothetical protein